MSSRFYKTGVSESLSTSEVEITYITCWICNLCRSVQIYKDLSAFKYWSIFQSIRAIPFEILRGGRTGKNVGRPPPTHFIHYIYFGQQIHLMGNGRPDWQLASSSILYNLVINFCSWSFLSTGKGKTTPYITLYQSMKYLNSYLGEAAHFWKTNNKTISPAYLLHMTPHYSTPKEKINTSDF